MTARLHVYFADDKARDATPLRESLAAAVQRIDSRLEVYVESSDRLGEVKNCLDDQERVIDLAIIDMHWPGVRGDDLDTAPDLLRRALERPRTVTILISAAEAGLLSYLYGQDTAASRPHAVMSKDHLNRESIIAGIVEAAFSVARLPLRTRVSDIRWDLSQAPNGAHPPIDDVVAGELACMAVARHDRIPMDHVTISPIGGGLSGSQTMLVHAESADPAHRRHSDLLLKLDQDPQRLRAEIDAHLGIVGSLPANTFAAMRTVQPLNFGGWSAIAFDQVPGVTVSNLATSILDDPRYDGVWDLVFSNALISKWVSLSRAVNNSPAAMLARPNGQLGGGRLQRLASHTDTLDLNDDVREYFRRPIERMFSTDHRPTAETIVHADLHTRNVLVSREGAVTWVDAASMLEEAPWMLDLSRFAAWLTCEQVMLRDDEDDERLRSALGFGSGATANGWHSKMRVKVLGTLLQAQQAWASAGLAIDIQRDWTDAVSAELLRVVYSASTFDRRTRAAAARAAYSLLTTGPEVPLSAQ